MADVRWVDDAVDVDWEELSALYRAAPLGEKPPDALETVFSASRFTTFAYAGDELVAVGRALADGLDCAYIADVAVRPDHQGRGLGREVIRRLVARAAGHKKILLYANPGTEGFYAGLGFRRMRTAMAIWDDTQQAVAKGLLEG